MQPTPAWHRCSSSSPSASGAKLGSSLTPLLHGHMLVPHGHMLVSSAGRNYNVNVADIIPHTRNKALCLPLVALKACLHWPTAATVSAGVPAKKRTPARLRLQFRSTLALKLAPALPVYRTLNAMQALQGELLLYLVSRVSATPLQVQPELQFRPMKYHDSACGMVG